MSSESENSTQRRPKIVHAGQGVRLNVQGIVFSYKQLEKTPMGTTHSRRGSSRHIMERQSTFIIARTKRFTFSKANLKSNAAANCSKPLRALSRCCRRVSRTDSKTYLTNRAKSYA